MGPNNISYTGKELDLLCECIEEPSEIVIYNFRHVLDRIISCEETKEFSLEIPIHRTNLNKDSLNVFYGEDLYYTVFGSYQLEFWSRHLSRFLFKATLPEMPLLINTPYICQLAKWRLTIAK